MPTVTETHSFNYSWVWPKQIQSEPVRSEYWGKKNLSLKLDEGEDDLK